jgi:hypothetical protein
MGDETKNFQFINSGIIKISKIIFYNKFLIFIIIPKPEYIPIFGNRNIIDYLDNLALYINKINLKPNRKLQSIIENRGEYLLL